MKVDQKILDRIEQLISLGEKVLSTSGTFNSISIGDLCVDAKLANQWATSSQSLLARVFGEKSDHYKNFTTEVASGALMFSPVERAMGILRAAKDDYEHDYLFDVRRLIEAEVFDDFLEQAQHLCDSGYFQPAAVIAGTVLEDGIRKLCHRNSISIAVKPKLDKMNADLAKKGVYNKLVQKQITAYADIRNKAAHGKWNEFSKNDVIQLLQGVRNFMSVHFT